MDNIDILAVIIITLIVINVLRELAGEQLKLKLKDYLFLLKMRADFWKITNIGLFRKELPNGYLFITACIIILLGASLIGVLYFLSPHSAIGEWKSKSISLTVFDDHTAIVSNKFTRESCAWSDKKHNLIVLTCTIGGQKRVQRISTFKTEAYDTTGYFDYFSEETTKMTRVND